MDTVTMVRVVARDLSEIRVAHKENVKENDSCGGNQP